jgi:O-acetyl-ADP-ribose deacetylase (regulator of RNase III)
VTRLTSLPPDYFRANDIVASFLIDNNKFRFHYAIHEGVIESFSSFNMTDSGIVMAGNEDPSSPSGIIGINIHRGDMNLREHLKNVSTFGHHHNSILPGEAIIMNNGRQLESMKMPRIILAFASKPSKDRHDFLMEAYQSALNVAREAKLKEVAFSLLGAVDLGEQELIRAIKIGVCAIATFEGYRELKVIHHYGFHPNHSTELTMSCMTWCSNEVLDVDESEI